MNEPQVPILTIDGPSSSGKGTISRIVAARVHWNLLDSGALYRLVALAGIRKRLDPDDVENHVTLARSMRVDAIVNNSFGFGGHNACIVARKFAG